MKYEPVDLTMYALAAPPGVVCNGGGVDINIGNVIQLFSNKCQELAMFLTMGKVSPKFRMWVPDLWHVTKGSAKCFAPGDAEIIWQEQVKALEVCRKVFRCENKKVLHNMPCTQFSSPVVLVS